MAGAPKGLSFDDIPDDSKGLAFDKPGLSFDALPAEEQGPPIPQPAPVTAGGLAKAGGTGLVKGTIGSYIALADANPVLSALRQAGILTPENVQAAVEAVTGPLHKPENRAERFAETGGEFVPGAVAGGGLLRTAANFVKGAVAGLVTEGAGQAAEAAGASPGVEKAVRLAASVAAPLGLNRGSIGKKPAAPTQEELVAAADKSYDTMRASGAAYDPIAVAKMAADAKMKVGIGSEVNAPQTHAILDQLRNIPKAEPGARITAPVEALDQARSRLREIASDNAGTKEGRAASLAASRIDDFVEAASSETIAEGASRGAAKTAAEALKEGRANLGAAKRSQAITSKEYNAELQTEAAHSGANADNALRQNIKQLLRKDERGVSEAKRQGYSDEEIAALESVVGGGVTRNSMRSLANLMGGGRGLGAALYGLAGAGVGGASGIGLAAVPVIGALLKSGQNALAERAIAAVDEAVRRRSPLYSKKLQELPPNIARDLINALAPSMGAIPNQ